MEFDQIHIVLAVLGSGKRYKILVLYLFVVAVFSGCGHPACKFVDFSDLCKLIRIWQIVA